MSALHLSLTIVLSFSLRLPPVCAQARPKKRKHDLMRQVLAGTVEPVAATAVAAAASAAPVATRDLCIRYLLSPREFLPHAEDASRVGAVVFERSGHHWCTRGSAARGTLQACTRAGGCSMLQRWSC